MDEWRMVKLELDQWQESAPLKRDKTKLLEQTLGNRMGGTTQKFVRDFWIPIYEIKCEVINNDIEAAKAKIISRLKSDKNKTIAQCESSTLFKYILIAEDITITADFNNKFFMSMMVGICILHNELTTQQKGETL